MTQLVTYDACWEGGDYLFSEVDDDVGGSGQSFFPTGPQSRERTFEGSRNTTSSVCWSSVTEWIFVQSEVERVCRVNEDVSHRWDSSRGWKFSEVWEELLQTEHRPVERKQAQVNDTNQSEIQPNKPNQKTTCY